MNHFWESQQWISSGFDESTAQRVRSKTFQRAEKQHSVGSLDWLRRLHRSHSPQASPFSTCMHRADAATVSYTEVTVSSRQATMRYHAGTPCQSSTCSVPILRLSHAHLNLGARLRILRHEQKPAIVKPGSSPKNRERREAVADVRPTGWLSAAHRASFPR